MVADTQLTTAELDAMVLNARIVEADRRGAKVYLLQNGSYLKLFRRRRLLSSALLTPYSRRFIRNAAALQARNIPTLQPLRHFLLEDRAVTAVLYEPLQGDTLRSLARNEDFDWAQLFDPLALLVRALHDQGVYFRSLHLGNIVLSAQRGLGLIDIADMKIFSRPLSQRLRERNLAHFKRYLDHEQIHDFPFERLKARVLQH